MKEVKGVADREPGKYSTIESEKKTYFRKKRTVSKHQELQKAFWFCCLVFVYFFKRGLRISA